MDSRLFMEIGVENTTFQAIDKSPYEQWIPEDEFSHVVLQRLVMISTDNTLITATKKVAETPQQLRNPLIVEDLSDGLYYYQKLLLPTKDHTTDANTILWYDVEADDVKYYDEDSGETETYKIFDDFDKVYEIVRKEYPDNCFYFDDYAFTMYSLVKCYVLLEKQRLDNYFRNNCRVSCSSNLELENKADILLAAITVINDLLEKEEFVEAQRILNGLHSCGNLCKDDKKVNNCGCGRD